MCKTGHSLYMKRGSGKDWGEGNSPKSANSKPTVISSSPHQTDAIDGCLTDWWSACTFHQARENKVEVSSRPCFRWEIVIYFGPVRQFTQLKYAFLSWNTQDPKVYIRFWGNFIWWKLGIEGAGISPLKIIMQSWYMQDTIISVHSRNCQGYICFMSTYNILCRHWMSVPWGNICSFHHW